MLSNPFNPLSGATAALSNPFEGIGAKQGEDGEEKKGKKDKDNKDKDNEDEVEEDDASLSSEIVDDIIQEGVHDDNQEETVSPEARAWANQHFKNEAKAQQYAKFYNLAKDRDSQDINDLSRQRTWKVRLRAIRYTNHGDLGDFFVCFNFGWNFRLSRKLLRVKASGQNRKDKEGRPVEQKRRWKWVKSGTRGKVRYTQVKKDVEKGKPTEFDDSIEFTWTGSYFDLYDKVLHAEVWIWHEFAPNEYLAKAEKPLKDIASGEMNMKGSEWDIKTEIRRKGRREQVVIGTLEFQCIFQEVLNYTIKFQNWTTIFSPWLAIDEPVDNNETLFVYPKASFTLNSSYGMSRTAHSKAKKIPVQHPHLVKMDVGQVGTIAYKGTRLDLEESTVSVNLCNESTFFIRNEVFGRARIPLTMVVENGFLSSKLVLRESDSGSMSCGTMCRGFKLGTSSDETVRDRKAGQIYGSVDIDAEDPINFFEFLENPGLLLQYSFLGGGLRRPARLHREFAQIGELFPPELKDYPPFNYSYLAVHIMAARDLLGADANGLSDPYVTVTWGGQRQNTKTLQESLDPVFDETLYFRIHTFDPNRITPEELAVDPYVRITVWDADEAGSSDLLGTTKLYLDQIIGAKSNSGELRNVKSRSMLVRRKKNAKKRRWREEEIQTRVFTGELRLEGLPEGVDSFVKIAAWFRGPDGDLKDKNNGAVDDRELLVLPNMKERERYLLTKCLRRPLEVQYNLREDEHQGEGSSYVGLCKACALHNQCEVLQKFNNSINKERLLEPLSNLFDELNLKDFTAMNQYGEFHFLPSFLQPISPPKSMLVNASEEEIRKLAIRTSDKPNLLFYAANFARAIEFDNFSDSNGFDGAININPKTWLSPDFFLSMKKGDIKAHVLLLCNLFLGLGADAYVCVGFAKNKSVADSNASRLQQRQSSTELPKDRLVPHVWIMTRHSDSAVCVKHIAPPKNDREESNWKSTQAANRDKVKDYGGAVQFWEVSYGMYFPPLPNRWEGQNDELLLKEFHRVKREKVVTKAKKESTKEADNETKDRIEDDFEADALQDLPEDAMLEPPKFDDEDFVDLGDQHVLVEEIFEFGRGQTHEVNGGPYATKVPSSRGINGGELGSADQDDYLSDDSASEVENGELGESEESEKLKKHKERAKFVKSEKELHRIHSQQPLPYKNLLFVFNHRNLWVNMQDSLDPRKITYDIEEGRKYGWQPLVQQDPKTKMTVFTPHYSGRTLGPKLTEEKVSELQNDMTMEIMSGIENFRDSHNVLTRFSDAGTGIPKCMQEVLESKHALDLVDKVPLNGWASMGKESMWVKDTLGDRTQEAHFSAMRALEAKTPAGYTGRIRIFKVNSSDPKEVRRLILNRRILDEKNGKPTINIHEETLNGRESFAVAVKVIPYPNSVCMVYVGVLVFLPKPDDGRKDEQNAYHR